METSALNRLEKLAEAKHTGIITFERMCEAGLLGHGRFIATHDERDNKTTCYVIDEARQLYIKKGEALKPREVLYGKDWYLMPTKDRNAPPG
jgi:hypothetical protein|tara:strand:+ start:512 stop:787 length:276 start_codon:yes stop_codon:yes gene_type:complete